MFRQGLVCLLVVLLVSGLGAGEGNITCQGGDRSNRSVRGYGHMVSRPCVYIYIVVIFVNNGIGWINSIDTPVYRLALPRPR